MSALTHKDVSTLIRRRMRAPVSERLRFVPLIDQAILLVCRETATNDDRRHMVLTDPATTLAALNGSGIADLTALIADPRIILDRLRYGDIFHSSSTNPLVLRPGLRAGNLDAMYLHYDLQGHNLRTLSSDKNVTPLSGNLSLAVPYWATLAELDEQLVPNVVEKCCELLQENKREYEAEMNDE